MKAIPYAAYSPRPPLFSHPSNLSKPFLYLYLISPLLSNLLPKPLTLATHSLYLPSLFQSVTQSINLTSTSSMAHYHHLRQVPIKQLAVYMPPHHHCKRKVSNYRQNQERVYNDDLRRSRNPLIQPSTGSVRVESDKKRFTAWHEPCIIPTIITELLVGYRVVDPCEAEVAQKPKLLLGSGILRVSGMVELVWPTMQRSFHPLKLQCHTKGCRGRRARNGWSLQKALKLLWPAKGISLAVRTCALQPRGLPGKGEDGIT